MEINDLLDSIQKAGDVAQKRAEQVVELQDKQMGGIVAVSAALLTQKMASSPELFPK